MRVLTAYLATMATMLVMDFAWLTGMGGFYHDQLGPLLKTPPNMVAAAAFYLLYLLGVTVFVVLPSLAKAGAGPGGWRRAAVHGGLFGLVGYGVYDLTNLATLSGFTLSLTLADMSWGVVITAVSATVGFAVARRFG